MAGETLDLREVAPRERHPRVFAAFDGLEPGQHFRLVNDHDPRPLRYQMEAERAGEVDWTVEEDGPERWVIRLARRQANPSEAIVTLDVRPDVREGREPFSKIMATVSSLGAGQTLVLINDFEPRPLYDILAQRGFTYEAGRTTDGAWRVVFARPS